MHWKFLFSGTVIFLIWFLPIKLKAGNPEADMESARFSMESGDYESALRVLKRMQASTVIFRFHKYLLFADLNYSLRAMEQVRNYSDSAFQLIRTGQLPPIYLALVYRNYSRFHHYNIVADDALAYADSALWVFHRNKSQQHLIPVYSLYQAKASALRNKWVEKRLIYVYFDSAFQWIRRERSYRPFELMLLKRSYANALLDSLTAMHGRQQPRRSFYRRTITEFSECIGILRKGYPNNKFEMGNLFGLMALCQYQMDDLKGAYSYLEQGIVLYREARQDHPFLMEGMFTLINWENSILDRVLDKASLKEHCRRHLRYLLPMEDAWIRWTFDNENRERGNYRMMYSNNYYAAVLSIVYRLYRETGEGYYKDLFFQMLQKDKFYFFANGASEMKAYHPQRTDVFSQVNDSTAYIDYCAMRQMYRTEDLAYMASKSGDTIIPLPVRSELYSLCALGNTEDIFHTFQDYRRNFFHAYQQLFEPVARLLLPKVNHLVLVRSVSTSNLNFDFLVPDTSGESYPELNYVFKRYHIRYLPCLALARRNTPQVAGLKLAMAPSYHDYLYPLPGLEKQVKQLRKYGFECLSGDRLSRLDFIQSIGRAEVFEFAGHFSTMTNQYAHHFCLELQSDRNVGVVHITDILKQPVNMKLAVLALCEAGKGEIEGSDISESVCNYFLRSGAASAVYSITKIDDQSTAFILDRFFKYLSEGMRKDEALRQAKVDYLSKATTPEQFAPIYWAALMLIGDPEPLVLPGEHIIPLWAWIVLLTAAAVTTGFWISRRRHQRAKP